MSGYMGDLSPTQEKALEEIRTIFAGQLNSRQDDYLLLQFLRARRFDVKRTEEMLRKHLQFRDKFPEEYFLTEYQPPELLTKHLLPPLLGYDKEGCPVRIIHIGHQDVRGLVCCVRRPEIRKCITWFLDTDKEAMRKRSKETGVHIETRTFIFDLEGLSLRQIYHKDVYDLVLSFLRLYEGNFPENLKVAYIINTPPFFSWLFNMVKSLLTEDTVKKLKLFGYSGWKEELLECIDADVLPVIYGGTRTDPDGDPKCPSMIRVFSPIPKKYYLSNTNRLNPDSDPKVSRVQVGRRSKHSVPIRVDVSGSTVSWDIDVRAADVRAHLVYEGGATPEVVVEPVLVSGEYGTENGCYLAEKTGKYSLVLDNSYSLLRNKTVFYRIYVSTCTVPSSKELNANDKSCLITVA
ncbi:hypothetical protein JTE90_000118 [Oedothorax gibbosus]|uniref:SEC14-like protein 2 n=1 Tax=Oedothorax gibbosus TaxID=931172 RepID=A0AAV6V1V7_9ARAC|nr:hypothetical protein JTE90_000118 [Oedothorax gibbosus]